MKQNYMMKSALKAGFVCALLGISSGSFAQLYSFDTFTFTNAGATGIDGPSLPACVTEYTGAGAAWAADPAFLNMTTNGIQEWTVPATGDYTIEVGGAQGGNHLYTVDPEDGGLGAIMEGTFALTEGQILYLLVGQQGGQSNAGSSTNFDNAAPGGGGGTFVWDPTDDALPLVAAGGGSGGSSPGGYLPKDANSTEDGNDAESLTNGGSGGNGGTANNGGASYWAGGGSGWLTNGTGGNNATNYNYVPGSQGAQGGRRPLDGGQGGIRWDDTFDDEGGDGGFGGGGGGGSDNMGSGGGGGYSGGGGGRGGAAFATGGGGGSFNTGIDQTNLAAANTGMGYITITLLCNPLVLDIPETMVCDGTEVSLSAVSATGGIVSWDLGVMDGVSFLPPADATTTYSATSTSPDDCEFSVEIFSTPVPTIVAESDVLAACEGAFLTVFGSGGDTYTWTGDGAFDPTDGVSFPAEGGTTTYTVIGSLLGCEGPAADITLEGAPQPDVVGTATPAEICLGESFNLAGSGADVITFNWGGGITDGDDVTPAAAGTYIYTLIGNTALGCGDTTFVTAVVNANPIVNAGSDITVCEADDVILSGSGATSYAWTPSITDGVAFGAEAGTTTYTVVGTNDNSCESSDDVVVIGIARPEITSAVITPEYFGADGTIDITVAGGSGGYLYSWSHGPTTEDAVSLVAGTYTVTIDDITTDPGLCSTEATYVVDSNIGIEDNDLTSLNAYPNPTTDQLTIVYEGTFNYEITTTLGSVVMTGSATDQEQLSMDSLANGTYIVKVIAGNTIEYVQVVKQ